MTLGEELKRRREERGIDLGEITEATCIGVRFLRAIEDNDFNALPGGLFTRSFIRSYAHYVGMDEKEALRLYFQQTGQSGQTEYELTSKAVRAKARSSMWANVIIALAVLSVLAIGGFAGWNYWQRAQSTSQPPPVKTVPIGLTKPTQEPAIPATPPPTVATPPAPVTSESEPQEKPQEPRPSPEAPAEAAKQPTERLPSKTAEPHQTKPPLAAADTSHLPAESPPSPIQLRMSLQVNGECWVAVQPDAAEPYRAVLQAGEQRSFEARERLVISIGNLSLVSITINGHSVQLPHSGQVVEGIVITPRNLAQFIKQ